MSAPLSEAAASDEGVTIARSAPARRLPLGYIPSKPAPETPRHGPAHFGAPLLPASYQLPFVEQIPVRDQGDRQTCVGHAFRELREYLALAHHLTCRLSMEFLYDEGKQRDGDPTGEGTSPDAVMQVLAHLGTPHEATLPDQPADELVTPDQLSACRQEASAFQVASYGLVPDAETAMAAIYAGKPVVAGVLLGQREVEQSASTGTFTKQEEPIVGGHAILLIGWKTVGTSIVFTFRNSWGTAWGQQGNGTIAASYPDLFADAWTAEL
jgi:C1A family cysteine protease